MHEPRDLKRDSLTNWQPVQRTYYTGGPGGLVRPPGAPTEWTGEIPVYDGTFKAPNL